METPSQPALVTKTYSAPIDDEYFNVRIDNSTKTDYDPRTRHVGSSKRPVKGCDGTR